VKAQEKIKAKEAASALVEAKESVNIKAEVKA